MEINSTLLLAFLEKVFVILLAPAGIWFGWFLQRRDKAEERADRRRERFRDKAEEVFAELSAVQDASKAAVFYALQDLHGSLEKPGGFSPDINIDRLRALLWMYFPGADQVMLDHASAMYQSSNNHCELIEKVKADDSLSVSEKLQRIKESSVDEAMAKLKVANETVSKLAIFMNQEIKKLL